MVINVSSAVAKALANAGIKPAGGVNVVIQSKPNGGSGSSSTGGGSSSGDKFGQTYITNPNGSITTVYADGTTSTSASKAGVSTNVVGGNTATGGKGSGELVPMGTNEKQVISNVAKGLLITGLEKIKNPENAIKLLNANVSGNINNQSMVNPSDLKTTRYPTNFSDRGQIIADIRAGKYEGIVIDKSGRIKYEDGSGFVGVKGDIIYDVNTGKPITKENPKVVDIEKTPFGSSYKNNPLIANAEQRNTLIILTDEFGKAKGVEYGGQSLTLEGFENTYNAKLLQDPSNGEFFLGSVGKAYKERLASISGDVKPITNEELNDVQRTLLRAKIKAVTTGELGIVDALTNTKVQAYLKKEGNWAYDKITSVTTEKLQKYAQIAKEQATQVLNESNFKTGNKKIDITAKSLGYISYFGGSAGAYALNMISGLGNVALGLTFKTNDTLSQIIKASPAIIKNSAFEIYRTINPRGKLGSGTIEDFFGTALTLATIAQTASSFSKYGSSLKNIKMTKQLKKDLPAIRQAVRQSQTLLKKEQVYTQRVFVKDSNKWNTFGKAYQAMKNMNAKHDWFAISNKKASVILQRSIIQNKNVRLTNFMVAKTTTEKILSFFKKYNNGNLKFIERFYDNKKIASYLSKVNARRAYTFIEVRGAKYVTAIDGRGAVSLLRNRAEIANFIKNAKFGKFSFTGSRVVGGNIDTILNINNKAFIGSEAFSYLANKRTAGITTVRKVAENQGGVKVFNYFRGKSGSKIFRTIKERANSDYAWRKSVDNAVKNLEKWGKNNPEEIRSLVKDLNKVYNPKDISYKQWRASTQRAGMKLDNWINKNPDKFRALIADSKKIYGNGMQQVVKRQALTTELPKNIAVSKGISGSVVGSQLKAVTKAISKAITKNDLALKTGYRAVVTASGLMFFDKYGKLVSGSDATFASNKSIDRIGNAIRDIISDNDRQSPSFRISQGGSQGSRQGGSQRSSQQSQQKQMEKMQQSSARSGRTNFRFKFEPFKPRVPLPSLDKRKNATIVKKILGNKLAPSYRIVIGSGKKVKALGGRYTAQDAISKGAYTIDRTKERTIRIVPTKQKPNAQFKMNYLRQANRKFRNYRIKRGQRVRYSSTRLIEKRKYFNDLEKLGKRRRK